MIINYVSPEDKLSAELIQSRIGGRLVQGFVNPSTLTEDLVTIGGQQANRTYDRLASGSEFFNGAGFGVFPVITSDSSGRGFVFVGRQAGFNVYGVAGFSREDTVSASLFVALNGLPSFSISTGAITDAQLITINLRPGFGGQAFVNLSQILAKVTNLLPGFDVFGSVSGDTITFLVFRSLNVTASVLPAIPLSVALIVIAIVLGIVAILSYNLKDLLIGKTQSADEKELKEKIVESGLKAGLSAEDIARLLKALGDGSIKEETSISSTLITLAAIGIGAVVLVNVIPALGKKR